MDWMNYFDVSSSMLFEATADSEADSDINKNMDHALLREDVGLADDDALSCSCDDSSDFKDFDQCYSTADREFHHVGEEEAGLADDHNKNFDDDDDDDDEDDVEDGVVDQLWINGRDCHHQAKDLKKLPKGRTPLMEERQGKKKLKVCAEEFINQRDKDRLFWETCLAS